MKQHANVLHGVQWAATPSSENGTGKTLPQSYQGGLWSRFKSWFQWENLTVAGREVKGFVITPTIAVTLCVVFLSAFLGAIGWAYTSSTKDSRETRDAVIRMETMLNERTRSFEREQDKIAREVKEEKDLALLQRQNQDRKLMQMELALRQKGVNIE